MASTRIIATQIKMFALNFFMSCAVHFKKIAAPARGNFCNFGGAWQRHNHDIQAVEM